MLKWSCDGCKSYAKDSDWLVYQRDKLERVVLKDSDNISWIECVNCKKGEHLKCISNVKEEQLSQNNTAYTCCHSKIYQNAMQSFNKRYFAGNKINF